MIIYSTNLQLEPVLQVENQRFLFHREKYFLQHEHEQVSIITVERKLN